MLGKITIEELRLIWGFEIEVAEPIFEAINSTPAITGIDDLDIRLTVEQLSMLIEKLSSFNQYQLNYFNKTMPDRAETISAIQRLNLDKGGDDTLLGSLVTSPVIFPADDFVKE